MNRPYRGAAWYYAQYRYGVRPQLAGRIAQLLSWGPSTTVLDLGCGPAHLAVRLAPYVGHIVAVDREPDRLAEGRRRVDQHGLANITFLCGQAEQAPTFLHGPVEAVTIGWALHWFRDPDALLARLAETVMTESGAVVISGEPALSCQTSDTVSEVQQQINNSLASYLIDTPEPSRPTPVRPYRDLLAASPFSDIYQVVDDYVTHERFQLDAYLGFLYSNASVLERLGHRRADFEAEIHRRFGNVDLDPRDLEHRDVALIGRL